MSNITIDDIIKKLVKLDKGIYEKGEFTIKTEPQKRVNYQKSTPFTAEICDENYVYTFEIPFTIDYNIHIHPKNNDYDFSYIEQPFRNNKESLFVKDDGKEYLINKRNITCIGNDISCYLHGNTIIRTIDKNCSIGYNFDDKKMYVYNKKNNIANNNLNEDYIKTEYNFNDDAKNKFFNTLSEGLKEELKKQTENEFYKKLIDTINVPKLKTDLEPLFKELLNIASVYNTNKEYLNLLEDQDLLIKLNNFIDNVVMNEADCLTYDFKESIDKIDLKDINNLRKLKKDINKIIKVRKKNNKTKVLKNTDIEN